MAKKRAPPEAEEVAEVKPKKPKGGLDAIKGAVDDPTGNADLLQQARDHFAEVEELRSDDYKNWLDDAKFRERNGNQWPEKIRKEREAAGRPCLEIDEINQYLRQVVNDGRMNRPSPRVSPIDGNGDIKVAGAYKDLIRSICSKSKADEAFDTALDHAAGNGFGFFRVVTRYEHGRTFHQELAVMRVRNPMAIRLGPHQEADGSDAEYGFVLEKVRKTTYKKAYPQAKVVDFKSEGFTGLWSDEHHVIIAEYFYKVYVPETLLHLSDDTAATIEEYERDLREPMPEDEALADPEGDYKPRVIGEREEPVCKVKWGRLSGCEILERKDWVNPFIPIIPVYGVERDINGKVSYEGMTRPAKDPQRLFNFSRSGFAEHVSLSTRTPWVAAEGQLEAYMDDWERSNRENVAVLNYKPVSLDGMTALPPPGRPQSGGIPAGLLEDIRESRANIQSAMGMYQAALGQPSNEKSGVAIKARDRQSDVGTFHYHDNLNRAIRYLCRQLVSAIPNVIDSKRSVRLLAEDGKATMVTADPRLGKPYEQRGEEMIYNLGSGQYDVDVDTGPSFTTKRQEAAEGMLNLTSANPSMWNTHGDLIVKAQDWPNADEFAERSKLALPPEIRDAVEAKERGKGSPEARAAEGRIEDLRRRADEAIGQRDQALEQQAQQIAELEQKLAGKQAESAAKLQDADTREYQAHTERLQVVSPAALPELVQMVAQQVVAEIMRQLVPQQPPPAMPAPPEPGPEPGFFMPEGNAL